MQNQSSNPLRFRLVVLGTATGIVSATVFGSSIWAQGIAPPSTTPRILQMPSLSTGVERPEAQTLIERLGKHFSAKPSDMRVYLKSREFRELKLEMVQKSKSPILDNAMRSGILTDEMVFGAYLDGLRAAKVPSGDFLNGYTKSMKDRVFLGVVASPTFDVGAREIVSKTLTPSDLQNLAGSTYALPENLIDLMTKKIHPNAAIIAALGGDFIVGPGTPNPGDPPPRPSLPGGPLVVGPAVPPIGVMAPRMMLTAANIQVANLSWQGPNRRKREFWRRGFPDVAALGKTSDGELTAMLHCTASLIAPNWALTAAHCVTRSGSKFLMKNIKTRIALYRPMANGPACLSMPEVPGVRTCEFRKYAMKTDPIIHENYSGDPKDGYDIALFQLDSDADICRSRLSKIFEGHIPSPTGITIAGYGFTGLAAADKSVALEIGWRDSAKVEQSGVRLDWTLPQDFDQSSTCHLDSGGPVYIDNFEGFHVSGYSDEPHEIISIISGGFGSCLENLKFTSNVAAAEIREWISGKVASAPAKCPQ